MDRGWDRFGALSFAIAGSCFLLLLSAFRGGIWSCVLLLDIDLAFRFPTVVIYTVWRMVCAPLLRIRELKRKPVVFGGNKFPA
jgi:ABC-type sulfate transport system permease subunit